MPHRTEEEFHLRNLIICEGPDDVAFFAALIEKRTLPKFHIRYTGKPDVRGVRRGGNSLFGETLRSYKVRRDFHVIKDILLVTDSDADPERSFDKVKTQVLDVGFSPPHSPLMRSNGCPAISIMVIRQGPRGNLECYCTEAVRSADPVNSAFVDGFMSQVINEEWTPEMVGKLWLRVALASRYRQNPFIHLGELIRQAPDKIPLEHVSFNSVANYLATFGAA